MDTPALANQQKTCIHQFCADTGCRQDDLLRVIVDTD